MHEDDFVCRNNIKRNEMNVYISLKGNNLACSTNN